MPIVITAAGVATGVGLLLSAVGVGFAIHAENSPVEDKIDGIDAKVDELDEKIDELEDNLDELGVQMLEQFDIVRDTVIETAINTAVAEVATARGSLERWRRTEEPGEGQTLDVIVAAEEALNKVLVQAEGYLSGANPVQAVGFLGSLGYALGVRLQVAVELEGGAFGADSLSRSLQDAADLLMRIHGQMPKAIEDTLVVERGAELVSGVPILPGFYSDAVIDYTVTVRSPTTGEEATELVRYTAALISEAELQYLRQGLMEPPGGVAEMLARLEAEVVEADMAAYGFVDLPEIADHYYDLSDGEEVLGTSGDDPELRGTAGADLITGLAGDDWMRGLGDHDVLRGGSGDDNMHGGADNDRVEGEDGRDRVKGGGGEDALYGGEGNDRLYGDGSSDYLEGGGGADRLYGGANRDVLVGGDGQDLLEGGDGKDTLEGGQGHDEFVLDGRNPDVILDFGFGNDTITLDEEFFASLGRGQLSASEFAGAGEPLGSGPQVIYQGGSLYFDADGRGSGEAVKIAELEGNPDLGHLDIFVM